MLSHKISCQYIDSLLQRYSFLGVIKSKTFNGLDELHTFEINNQSVNLLHLRLDLNNRVCPTVYKGIILV